MSNFDERTPSGWPLPFKSNTLEFDVERLRETFNAIDEALSAFEEGTKKLLNEQVAGLEEKQYILDARMDVIAGQTTEDSEILDARVDAKGVTHPNVGHNVRTLHSEVIEINEALRYGIEEFRGLLRQFNELAYAQIQGELNSKDAHERRKAELAEETQARAEDDEELREGLVQETLNRQEQGEMLQAQTQELSKANILQSLNLQAETEQRRKTDDALNDRIDSEDAALQAQINDLASGALQNTMNLQLEILTREEADTAESIIRADHDGKLQTQIDELAGGLARSALTASENNERRKHETQQEAQTRTEQDALLQQQIDEQTEQSELQQTEIDNLTEAVIRDAINLSEESDRRASADSEETQAREIQGEVLQAQINDLSNASLRHDLNAHREAELRREGFSQLDVLQKQTAYQQTEIDNLLETVLRSSLNLHEAQSRNRADLQGETQTRYENEWILQAQIDNLAFAVMKVALTDYEAREHIKQYLGKLYQAVADTGNLTYMGAGVASTNEISSMLADVMSGTDDGEITGSGIPEALKNRVASSSEVSDMLAEVFHNNRS